MTNTELNSFKELHSEFFNSNVDYSYLFPFGDDVAEYYIMYYHRGRKHAGKERNMREGFARLSESERNFVLTYVGYVCEVFKNNSYVHGKRVSK